VWTDPPSELNAQFNLINDLDLKVNFSNNVIFGNSQSTLMQDTHDYLNTNQNINIRTDKDTINPVESVYLRPPSSGMETILISVVGDYVPYSPQPYSLVVSGQLAQGVCKPGMTAQGPQSLHGSLYASFNLTQTPYSRLGPSSNRLSKYVVQIIALAILFAIFIIVRVYISRNTKNKIPGPPAAKPTQTATQELPTLTPTGASFSVYYGSHASKLSLYGVLAFHKQMLTHTVLAVILLCQITRFCDGKIGAEQRKSINLYRSVRTLIHSSPLSFEKVWKEMMITFF
jgi:hypothetical protein